MRYINILSERNEGFITGYVKPILESKQLVDAEITGENLQTVMMEMGDHSWHCNAMWMFDLTACAAQSERNRLIHLIERVEKKAFKDMRLKMVLQIAQEEKAVADNNAKLELEYQVEQRKIDAEYKKCHLVTISMESETSETEEQTYQRNRQFALDRAGADFDWRYYSNKLENNYRKQRKENEDVLRKLYADIRDLARPVFKKQSLKYFNQLAELFNTCAEIHNASGHEDDHEFQDNAEYFDDPIDHEYDTRP